MLKILCEDDFIAVINKLLRQVFAKTPPSLRAVVDGVAIHNGTRWEISSLRDFRKKVVAIHNNAVRYGLLHFVRNDVDVFLVTSAKIYRLI